LYPLSSTGNIQYRIAKTDWSDFNEVNDYSYEPAAPYFSLNNHITVYYKGQLAYGQEPGSNRSASFTPLPAMQGTRATILPVSVYPNPVTGRVFYVTGGKELLGANIKMMLFDNEGRVVLTRAIEAYDGSTIRVTLPAPLASGVYLLQLNDRTPVRLLIR
jgi:hypothetical protein